VKTPRFRIAWLMAIVGLAAIDFTAIRPMFGSIAGRSETGELLLIGALPMANVLAAAILIRALHPVSHSFLLGFEVFGATALAFYAILAMFFYSPDGPIGFCLSILDDALEKIVGGNNTFIFFTFNVIILGLPQFAFALLGGCLSRTFKVTFTRR
jgi:hypothetical protein